MSKDVAHVINRLESFTPEEILDIAVRCWTDYIDVNRNTVHSFFNQFGPEIKEEFLHHCKSYMKEHQLE